MTERVKTFVEEHIDMIENDELFDIAAFAELKLQSDDMRNLREELQLIDMDLSTELFSRFIKSFGYGCKRFMKERFRGGMTFNEFVLYYMHNNWYGFTESELTFVMYDLRHMFSGMKMQIINHKLFINPA